MKNILKTVLCLILALFFVLPLASCVNGGGGTTTNKGGISIDDDKEPYSKETEAYATEVILGLLEYYVQKRGADAFFNEEKRTEVAKKLQEITAKELIAEEKYLSFISLLDNSGKAIVDEMLALDSLGTDNTKKLYLEISEELGSDYIGTILYNIALWSYDYKYDKAMADYEEYGYSYKLEDAQRARDDQKVLSDEVGKERFIAVINSAISIPEILFEGALDSEKMDSFSNEEILDLIERIELDSLNMSDSAWTLMLSYFVPSSNSTSAPYIDQIFYTMQKEGDLSELASIMNDYISLIQFAQDNLDSEDVDLLREGKRKELLQRAFAKFGDAEWTKFEKVTSISVESSTYELVAKRKFGNDFTVYAGAIEPITITELRDSVGAEGFLEYLERYIAGISPAFSYGINND